MRGIGRIVSALLTLAPVSAFAAPVYLTCAFTTENHGFNHVDLTMNEENGTVTMQTPTRVVTLRASFSRDVVTFGSAQTIHANNMVDRVSLRIARKSIIPKPQDEGQCQIVALPERAF